jgi:hypothetical protein
MVCGARGENRVFGGLVNYHFEVVISNKAEESRRTRNCAAVALTALR